MSTTFETRTELDGAIDSAIRSLLVTPPEGSELAVAIAAIRTASAYTDHNGATQHSPASIEAAVCSYAHAEGLQLRNTLLEALRLSLEA